MPVMSVACFFTNGSMVNEAKPTMPSGSKTVYGSSAARLQSQADSHGVEHNPGDAYELLVEGVHVLPEAGQHSVRKPDIPLLVIELAADGIDLLGRVSCCLYCSGVKPGSQPSY